MLVSCVGVVYEEYDSSLFRHIAKLLIRSVLNDSILNYFCLYDRDTVSQPL
nr:MAG TPA: hypothetical protein [Caudoviricetes sp.]